MLTRQAEMTDEDKHTLAMRTVDDQASVTDQLERFNRSLSSRDQSAFYPR